MTGFWGGARKSLVVELDSTSKLPELTGDLRESIKTLENHPGFQYLMHRQRFQKAQLMSTLQEGLGLSETQLRYIQAGLYWLGFMDKDIKSLTTKRDVSRPATAREEDEFQKIHDSLQLVGA